MNPFFYELTVLNCTHASLSGLTELFEKGRYKSETAIFRDLESSMFKNLFPLCGIYSSA